MAFSPFVYSAPMDAIAFTTATDLFEITATSDSPITIVGLELSQTTDLQDAAEEVLRFGWYLGATGGSGGTALTETDYNREDLPAVTAAVRSGGTASTGGTLKAIHGWNIRVPFERFWVPEMQPRFDSSEDIATFRLLAAPTDSITISGTLYWCEG